MTDFRSFSFATMHSVDTFYFCFLSQERDLRDPLIKPEDWLNEKITMYETSEQTGLHLPLKDDGSEYTIDSLFPDQRHVIIEVLNKLKEWIECSDSRQFKPLRMTVNGPGGSGKSVVINTLVSVIRKIFQRDDIIRVSAPTGTAAFNVGGETLHHLIASSVSPSQYRCNSMTSKKKDTLVAKFKNLLVLLIDERSLINSKDLGAVERHIAETIYEGGPLHKEYWGGLPVLILFGDDYQLPGTADGALVALTKKTGGTMVQRGRETLLSCAQHVMNLTTNKRVQENKNEDKELLSKVRTGDQLDDAQVNRLLSLHLDNVKDNLGQDEVNRIKQQAVYLFFKNEKRIRHNLQQLAKAATSTNPVAICKPRSMGSTTAKGDKRHFNSDAPQATMFCIGSKVALENKNFCPLWGLHNGAYGTVEEIVFSSKQNPNHGDLPLYVVCEFPLYCGPIWDNQNPKASETCKIFLAKEKNCSVNSSFVQTACSDSNCHVYVQSRLLPQIFSSFVRSIRKDNPQVSRTISRTG